MYEDYFTGGVFFEVYISHFFSVKQNWTSGILREEAAILDGLGK